MYKIRTIRCEATSHPRAAAAQAAAFGSAGTHISTFHRSTFITDEETQEARIIRVINVLMKFHLDERNFSRYIL